MKKISFNFLFPVSFLVILVFALSRNISTLPPLGKLLNPYIGFLQNEREIQQVDITIASSKQPIEVYFDDRQVAHVFAQNDHDMYLVQGYLTAKDRLWQMDFMSYASAGRLSEIFGDGYLDYDRLQRRVGMLSSAKSALEFIEANEETKRAMDAYTEGVNAYISALNYSNSPFEYKLMDYQPEKWTNLKSVLIMKYVSAMLTGYEEDISMSHMLLALGEKEFKKLYPEFNSMEKDNWKSLETLNLDSLPYREYINYEFLSNKSRVTPSNFNPKLGSNNWAINASKSKSGNPILCNDPHLGLSLPSIWYEIQLSSNSTNVYGVSIPGTIGVIIGYNDKIAWGVTNGATDVRDWYKPRIKSDYSAYEMDGKWKKMKVSIEEIKVKDQASFFDTIYSTEHGPIVIDNSFEQTPDAKNFALKWTLHEPANEFLTFIHLNKAKNYTDFKESISHYKCPIQNFVYASSNDTIAIHHQGMLYEKWNGQGRFLLDGTKKEHLYASIIPDSDLPQTFNPESGFVYSANNFPNFDTIDGYINGYYSETRAQRIKNILAEDRKFDVHDMQKIQLDNTNEMTLLALPSLLKSVSSLSDSKSKAIFSKLKKWNGEYSKESVAAYFFDEWWRNLTDLTWDELKIQDYFLRDPDASVLLRLILNEPNSTYFDKLNTSKNENSNDLIREAFEKTLKMFSNSSWGEVNQVSITHLSKIEALSVNGFSSSGHPNAINAISETWGPSWRMIVEMGEHPIGYGIYAGGQSGNPSSKYSREFIEDWKKGNYYKLQFFQNKKEAQKKTKTHFTITNKKEV